MSSLETSSQVSNQTPRNIVVQKSKDGFGFNVRGQVFEGGQVKSINGKLYGPLQHVSAISSQSAAEKAGLRIGDQILQINGVDVEGASHQNVVDLIQHGTDDLHLLVIASNITERYRRAQSSVESGKSSKDYSERRSLAIAIPDYSVVEANDEKFEAFNIHLAGRHICSRRYREFDALHQLLKQSFPDFPFNPLPKKWLFKLSEPQLDARRRGLEQYLDKICSVRIVGDCDIVQDFLSADVYMRDSVSIEVEIRVLLPDQSITNFKVKRFATADKVYEMLIKKIGLPEQYSSYFYLFEIIDYGFKRKLRPYEYPHQIYVDNCSSAYATSLCLQKFVFSPTIENELLKHPLTQTYLHREAVEQLTRCKGLKDIDDEIALIKYAQTCTDIYNTITFPLCPCSSRKDNGCVIVSVNCKRLRLHACSDNGKLEVNQIADFDWTTVGKYFVEGEYFTFEYKRATMKASKPVKLKTVYGQFMYDCFECILRELQLNKPAQ